MKADAKTQIIYNDDAVNIAAKSAVYNNSKYIYVWADNLPLPATPADLVTVKAASEEYVLLSATAPTDPPLVWDFDEYYSISLNNSSPLSSTNVPKILEAVIMYMDASGIHYIYNAPVSVNPVTLMVTVGDITSVGFEIQDTQDGTLGAITNFPGIAAFRVKLYNKG